MNFVAPVHQLKHVAEDPDTFRRPEHQVTMGVQRIVKNWKRTLLQLRAEINEDIAATDQVESRKRWVGRDVLPCESAEIAYGAVDLIGAIEFFEVTLQPLR